MLRLKTIDDEFLMNELLDKENELFQLQKQPVYSLELLNRLKNEIISIRDVLKESSYSDWV